MTETNGTKQRIAIPSEAPGGLDAQALRALRTLRVLHHGRRRRR